MKYIYKMVDTFKDDTGKVIHERELVSRAPDFQQEAFYPFQGQGHLNIQDPQGRPVSSRPVTFEIPAETLWEAFEAWPAEFNKAVERIKADAEEHQKKASQVIVIPKNGNLRLSENK